MRGPLKAALFIVLAGCGGLESIDKLEQEVTACPIGLGDCDGVAGCETVLDTITHCGGCAKSCSTNHSAPTCEFLVCVNHCSAGFADCDGDPSNGCETSLNTVGNCGACGAVCGNSHATASCTNGICAQACDNGWENCDSNVVNGCESNTPNDPAHCGSCANNCSTVLQHATPGCVISLCFYTSCDANFADCDGNPTNGCETALLTTVNRCGSCGNNCSTTVQHATAACTAGGCTHGTCNSGFADCDGNAANGCETPLGTTTACGGCGDICSFQHNAATCVAGACKTNCDPGFGDCDGLASNGCETALNTLGNCGACGAGCGSQNATASCSTGTCVQACNNGWESCDSNVANGCESNTPNDPAHCGSCATNCSNVIQHATPGCVLSLCFYSACDANFADCDLNPSNGCESSLSTADHCGSCGNNCTATVQHATAGCSAGACTHGTCDSGFADCDGNPANGCEAALNTNSNCGACGIACTAPGGGSASCSTGSCVPSCPMGKRNCGGTCAECCDASHCTIPPSCKVGPGTCVAGSCSYPNRICVAEDCRTTPSCDVVSNSCVSSPTTGPSCGASGCFSGTGVCDNGTCTGVTPKDCSKNVPACQAPLCDAVTGSCSSQPALDGVPCTPTNKCIVAATCTSGVCGGTVKSCSDNTPCRVAACNPTTGDCESKFASPASSCVLQGQAGFCDANGLCVVNSPKDAGVDAAVVPDLGGSPDLAPSPSASPDPSSAPDLAGGPIVAQPSGCSVGGGSANGPVWLLVLFAWALRRRKAIYAWRQ